MKIHSLENTGSISVDGIDIISLNPNGTIQLGTQTVYTAESYDNAIATGGTITNQTVGNQIINGDLIVTGSLTAQQFIVSSSVTYLTTSFASGSTKFGDSSDDTHQFTGSLIVSGSTTPLKVGSNLLFVSSSGNIGIGTTTPDAKIDVSGGNIYVRPTGGVYANNFGNYSGNATFTLGGIGNNLIISGGNVGIGIDSPLNVTTNRTSVTINGTSTSILSFGSGGVGKGYVYNDGTNLELYSVGDLVFAPGGPPKMWVTSGGNVGIGASTTPVYRLEVSTSSGSQRIRVGTLQNNNNTATFEAITTSNNTTATSGWIRAVYGGGLAIGTSAYTKTGGDSGNFANLSSESTTTAITVETNGNVSFSKAQKHPSNLWHVIPFAVQKGNGAGSADSRTILEITSDAFNEYFIHINYGARIQNVSDSVTNISSRMYGVNRFNGGSVAVTDSSIMAGSSGTINTHAPITAVASTSTKVIVKVDFSSSGAAASFVWGEIRIFSWEGITPTIVNNNW